MHKTIPFDSACREKCENCDGGPLVEFCIPRQATFFRCPFCGLLQKNAAALRVNYPQEYHRPYASVRRRKLRTARVRLYRLAPLIARPRPRLLDVGCSVGATVEAAGQLGWDAFGADISADAVTMCRDRGLPCHLLEGHQLPFPSQMFDVVTAWHVIEHVPDVSEALSEWYRVLAPGGLLVLETPSAECLKARLWKHRYRKFWPPAHRYTFTPANLAPFLERCGFEVGRTPWVVRPRRARPRTVLFSLAYQLYYSATRLTRTSKAFQMFCRRPQAAVGDLPMRRAA